MARSLSRKPRSEGAAPHLALIDRYVLRMTAWPMLGCLGVTVTSLLLERTLRLLDLLSQSNSRFGSVLELTANLLPHYLGLALPVAFFVALFIVITKLDDGSEIEAFLASGVPLTRLAAPYVALGLVLMSISLVVFGYLQPYSRYAYRAVLHAAVNAGWDGRLHGGAFVSDGDNIMTADSASLEGRRLQHVFIRRATPGGGEEVLTARSAQLSPQPDGKTVTLVLQNGARLSENRSGDFDSLRFDTFTMQTNVADAAALLRSRGGDERELTLTELAIRAGSPMPVIPRETLLAELYGRLARSVVLPFLPLIALPLGLAAKRRRRTAGLLLAGALLLGFQHGLQFGQGLAETGRVSPEIGVGAPFFLFTGFCLWMFAGSRRRPGETPIGRFVQALGDSIERLQALLRPRKAAAS
ncbi:LptF/LptG family permease [Phenylobacterium sp.]|uniref:LptF/LptG family permease n=1 Tax=Phenylobacterium sp. TaxID=1871053 RepID=UPI003982F19C